MNSANSFDVVGVVVVVIIVIHLSTEADYSDDTIAKTAHKRLLEFMFHCSTCIYWIPDLSGYWFRFYFLMPSLWLFPFFVHVVKQLCLPSWGKIKSDIDDYGASKTYLYRILSTWFCVSKIKRWILYNMNILQRKYNFVKKIKQRT